jgi:hypothetical protein
MAVRSIQTQRRFILAVFAAKANVLGDMYEPVT